MKKNVMIYNELKELNSPLADFPNGNVFRVPDGYFDSLVPDIMEGINTEYTIGKLNIPSTGMNIPAGYFENLADTIMGRIRQESSDSNERSLLLESIGKANVFTVPDGYFEQLPEEIIYKAVAKPAKVFMMRPRLSVFRYAVAATITGLLGMSLFGILDNKHMNVTSPSNDNSAVIAMGTSIAKDNRIDEEFAALSTDDIIHYLKDDGEDVNSALVASLTEEDEKSLPSEDSYYLDDNTLDNFLNDQHITIQQ